MALVSLGAIQERLLAAGKSPDTPAILIENATLESQREVFASLSGLVESVAEAGISGPSIIIVGQAVEVAEQARLLLRNAAEQPTQTA